MTTPRDDIAGLSERLNRHVRFIEQWNATSSPERHAVLESEAVEAVPDLRGAATQLDALLKERFKLITDLADMKSRAMSAEQERDALQARVKELESGIAHAHYRSDNCDAENQSLYNRLEAVESRALRAEQERDKLQAQLPEGMKHCTITFHECEKGHGWLHATNWIDNGCPWCQRDEAYERLKPFAKGWWSHQNPNVKISAIFNHNPFDERVLCTVGEMQAAYSLVRRLAGPEKEKKECNLGKDGGGDTSAGRLTAFANDGEDSPPDGTEG